MLQGWCGAEILRRRRRISFMRAGTGVGISVGESEGMQGSPFLSSRIMGFLTLLSQNYSKTADMAINLHFADHHF